MSEDLNREFRRKYLLEAMGDPSLPELIAAYADYCLNCDKCPIIKRCLNDYKSCYDEILDYLIVDNS